MPEMNHKEAALRLGGIDISGSWADMISPDFKNDTQETTSGSESTWRTFNPGLDGWTTKLTIVWDSDEILNYLHLFKAGRKTDIDWGPDGDSTGSPRFAAPIIIEGVKEITQKIDMSKWVYELAIKGDGEPTALIANGDTY